MITNKKIKYIFFCLIVFIIGIISLNLFNEDKSEKVKGIIHIWVKDNTYDYINECANRFMDENDRVTVYVDKIENYNTLKSKLNNEDNEVQIFECSYSDLYNYKLDGYSYYNYTDEILELYGNNFSDNTNKKYLDQYKIKAIPFTSRPLALYVKSSVLSEYGYTIDDFNTWYDVKRIGEEIYNKSNHKVKLISGTDQNYNDLKKLILLENLNEAEEALISNNVVNFMDELRRANILTSNASEEYIGKISSVDGVTEIINTKDNVVWNVGNVPVNGFGNNKFFTVDDTSLYILKNSNNELTNKFIKYVLTEDEMCIDYMKQGKFFLTYMYSYKSKSIEKEIDNIEGQMPLIVLSNIEAKSKYNKFNEKYEIIIKNLE